MRLPLTMAQWLRLPEQLQKGEPSRSQNLTEPLILLVRRGVVLQKPAAAVIRLLCRHPVHLPSELSQRIRRGRL